MIGLENWDNYFFLITNLVHGEVAGDCDHFFFIVLASITYQTDWMMICFRKDA